MVSNATPKFKQKQQKTDNKLLLLRNPMTTRSDQLVWKCKDGRTGRQGRSHSLALGGNGLPQILGKKLVVYILVTDFSNFAK